MVGRVWLAGLLVALLALFSLGPAAAHAASTVVVNTCDEAHLRGAITSAGAGGTVAFGCSGTITVAATIVVDSGLSGLTIDGSGQAVTISGGNAVEVLSVNAGVSLILNRLTITKGSTAIFGGGIYNVGALTISGSTISGNTAIVGGGIFNIGAMPTISGSTVSGNSADDAGAIYNGSGGTLGVTNSTFSGNVAHGFGGAIYNDTGGTLSISGSSFSGNSASNALGVGGGGIFIGSGGTGSIAGSTFTANNTSGVGGAIETLGVLSMVGSTVGGNSAGGSGGGMSNDGTLTITNSTFSGNSAPPGFGGGGIINVHTLGVTNSTFSGNSAGTGGAIWNAFGATTLANTILANSPTGGNCANGLGTLTDQGGNVDDGATCGFGAGSLSNANPLLLPLANNGGPTQTMAVSYPTSPAIGEGKAATCMAPQPQGAGGVDQRGLPRYASLRGKCDSGAFDTGGGIVPPLTLTGAIPLTAGMPGRLGFAASNHGSTFAGVAGLVGFNLGYITFQLGPNSFTVRQPVAPACSATDHCVGTTGLVNGLPGFILVPPGTATLTLSGTISSGRGAYQQGATATVTLSIAASAAGVVTVSKVAVSVAGVNGGNAVATWAAPFPAGTSIQVNDAAPLIP